MYVVVLAMNAIFWRFSNPDTRCICPTCETRLDMEGKHCPTSQDPGFEPQVRAVIVDLSANNGKLTTVVSSPPPLDFEDGPGTCDLHTCLAARTRRESLLAAHNHFFSQV
jgi:hypothetical protein